MIGVAAAVLAERYIPREWIAGHLGTGSFRNILTITFLALCLAGTLILSMSFQAAANRFPAFSVMFDYVK